MHSSATPVDDGCTDCVVLASRIHSTVASWRTCVMEPSFLGDASRVSVRQRRRPSSRQLRTTGTWRPVSTVTRRSLTPSSELQNSRVPDWTRHLRTYYFRCIVIASRSTQAQGRPGSQVISRSLRS